MKKTISILIMSLAVAGCGTAAANHKQTGKPPARLAVSLTEFAIKSPVRNVRAGKVTFDIRNAGKEKHELVVLRTARPAAGLAKAGASRVSEAGHVGELAGLAPGTSRKLTLTLAPGHYALICNYPGHYEPGMHADLRVS